VIAWLVSSAPLPNQNGSSQEGKGGRDERASRGIPPYPCLPEGRRMSRWATTLAYTWTLTPPPSEPNKPSGTLKPAANGTGTVSVSAVSVEAVPRRTSYETSVTCPGPELWRPMLPLPSLPKWINTLPPGSDAVKPRCMCLG
jgi:hypothetical protein